MARPLKPLPTMATLKPSGSSGLASVHSAVHGNSLNAGRSRRASNSRSPISSAVAMFMRVRSPGLGRLGQPDRSGVLLQPGHGLGDQKLTLRLVEVGRGRQLGHLGVAGQLVQRHPHRVQVRATSTARRMKAESTVVSMS